MATFSKVELVEFGASVLTAKGLSADDARYIAERAVETEAMGVTTHGLSAMAAAMNMVPDEVTADTRPEIVKEKGSTILIEANSGLSQIAMRVAVDKCIEKARANGIAHASIRNARWIGALSPYVLSLAREGFFAQAWAHSSQCKDCAPIGGLMAKFSTNPMAVAFPTHADPVVADMSTATISMGKRGQLLKAGENAPDKIFMDKDGNLSDDPAAFDDGGSILFTGGAHYGHKGYALSLWCEALTAMAGGYCNDPEREQRQSIHLTVIDPEAFEGIDYLRSEMERFITHVKDNKLRPGYDSIRLPGERAQQALRRNEEEGVPVPDAMLERLNGYAEDAGVEKLS
ncbi:Ldh family oxidoreductase [Planctomycetota bacterium]